MRRLCRILVTCLVVPGVLPGCSVLSSGDIDSITGEVHGSLIHVDGIEPPAGSEAAVMLQRIVAEGQGEYVAIVTIPDPGPTPIEFTLPYARTHIEPGERYVVRARIRLDDGRVILRESEAVPVLTRGGGEHAVVELETVDD